MSSIMNAINNAKNDSDKGSDSSSDRKTYDPKGNSHCFQKGAGPAWWNEQMSNRNNNSSGELAEFSSDPLTLLRGSGADFDPVLGLACTKLLNNGSIIESNPKTYNIVRGDNPNKVLQYDVSSSYSLKPYREIVVIPNDVTLKVKDFNNDAKVLDYLQSLYKNEDVRDLNVEIPLNNLLTPWGCSCWLDGEAITYQYLIGDMSINGDRYRKYLTIRSNLNGMKSTTYFVTVVRVVCENTEFHADVDGWQSLLNWEKTRGRIRRNARMDERIHSWHRTMSGAIMALSQISETFEKLAETKISDSISEKNKIIDALICESFNISLDGKTKRGENKFNEIKSSIYNRDLGGGDSETLLDLLNGITAYTQHFQQVNATGGQKFSEREKQEKLFMMNLMDDDKVNDNQEIFQRVVNLMIAA